MHIKKYLEKMDFTPKNANVESLNKLITKHIELFPFSSINVLLKKELPLDSSSLFNRIIQKNEGGYCFEHNKIFYQVLKSLGFEVTTLMARITLNSKSLNARTHRVTLVNISGHEYLVDVGFGALGPSQAISIEAQLPTHINEKSYLISKRNNELHLEVTSDKEKIPMYIFDLATYGEKDCDQGHFYSHKHHEAIFVNNLVVSKVTGNRVVHILNQQFHIEEGSNKEVHDIEDKEQLFYILRDEFNISLNKSEIEIIFNHSKIKSSIESVITVSR